MRVPPDIAAAISRGVNLGFPCRSDGTVTEGFEAGWGGGPYPPPGYLPWNILAVGNGDTYGFYWPIGSEDGRPITCTIMHDASQVLPLTSSFGSCIRLHLLTHHGDIEELMSAARDFGIEISDIALPDQSNDETPASLDGPPWTDPLPPPGIAYWGAPSAEGLLPYDPDSPHLLYLAAREALSGRQLVDAEVHLKAALDILPEYSEARALLAQVHRQQQDYRRTAETLMEAITSPRCFGACDRKKLLNWLQRLGDDTCPDSVDPLWKRRNDLSFVQGIKEKDDYYVLEELVGEYHRMGLGIRAVYLRILTGELMHSETISFRERNGWTAERYQLLLKADLEKAGLQNRLPAM